MKVAIEEFAMRFYTPWPKSPAVIAFKKNEPRKEVKLMLLYRFGNWFNTYSGMFVELIAYALAALI